MIPAAFVGSLLATAFLWVLSRSGNLFNQPGIAEYGSAIFDFINSNILSAHIFIYITNYIAPHSKKLTRRIVSYIYAGIILALTILTIIMANSFSDISIYDTVGSIAYSIMLIVSSHLLIDDK